jgi:hypothetical protein
MKNRVFTTLAIALIGMYASTAGEDAVTTP